MSTSGQESQVEDGGSRDNSGQVVEGEFRRAEDGEPVEPCEPPEWLVALMNHIEGQVAFGDTKAGLLLTADSILLAGLATAFSGDEPLVGRPTGFSHVLTALALTVLSTGLIAALMTILPNRQNLWPASTPPQCRFSFSWIASQPTDSFVRSVRADGGTLTTELATVVHGKAGWARRKFVRLYVAVWATTLGLLLALAAVAAAAL